MQFLESVQEPITTEQLKQAEVSLSFCREIFTTELTNPSDVAGRN